MTYNTAKCSILELKVPANYHSDRGEEIEVWKERLEEIRQEEKSTARTCKCSIKCLRMHYYELL